MYRTVNVLKELDLVIQLDLHQEGQSRYELKEGRKHHHHIRCQICGKIGRLVVVSLKEIDEVD